ncbi:hypothetical protein Efla_007131 [Eimeria flavescens]
MRLAAAAVSVDSAEVPAANWCINSSSSNRTNISSNSCGDSTHQPLEVSSASHVSGAGVPRCRRLSSRGTSNSGTRGLFADCLTAASTSWQMDWSLLGFEGGCPPFWEGASGILTGGGPRLHQLEAESSDPAVAVAAESAGERPAAAAAAAAAGSPHPSAAVVAAWWVAPGEAWTYEALGAPVHAGLNLNPRRAAAAAGGTAAAAVAVGLKESDEGTPLSSLSSSISSSRSNRDGSWSSSSLSALSTPEGPSLWEERPLRHQRPEWYT